MNSFMCSFRFNVKFSSVPHDWYIDYDRITFFVSVLHHHWPLQMSANHLNTVTGDAASFMYVNAGH